MKYAPRLSESHKPPVLIVDSNHTRRAAMAHAFASIAAVWEAFRTVDWKSEWQTEGDPPGEFVLALRHFEERDVFEGLPAGLSVYYGGHGLGDPRRQPGDTDVIARPIESAEAALSPAEARELLKYAQARAANEYAEPPVPLRELYLRNLPALVYLCQSYLGAWAGFRGNFDATMRERWQEAKPGAALEKMGWSKLTGIESAPPLAVFSRSLNYIEAVCRSAWWAANLGVPEEAPRWTRFRMDCEFEAHLLGSSELPPHVDAAIKEFEKDSRIPPELVVGMYLDVEKLITR